MSECEFTFHTHNVSLGRPCLYLYHKGFRDFEVGKGGGGGGRWGEVTCIKTSQIVSQQLSQPYRGGRWFSFAGRITINKRRHRALCLRFERISVSRPKTFLSHFFVFTWVMRPYSVTVHYLLFTVYCALSWQLVS